MNRQDPETFGGERRASIRFGVQAPAVATIGNRDIQAITRDISTRAIHFRTAGDEQKPPIGELVAFSVKVPPSVGFSRPCFIKGRGRTIRIEDADGEIGVVVELAEYEIQSRSA
jgi:hypothetical protein